ncbi:MAG: hypothetical protein CMO01_06200 [Thalassobius sp.]|nr:hypothetical protein [Thalassovita sp.]
MLSRVAESLFWMGRYLERTEHLARYINVEYFSSLDGSNLQQHDMAILSIADMIGLPKPDIDGSLNEEEVLVGAALDEHNPVSILSALFSARENARSVRESISSELWESINNLYHFVANYPVDVYKTRGLSDFTNHVLQHCSNVRGRIEHTLLHDVGWKFIQLGMQVETASQIVRIMISKLNDIEANRKLKIGRSIYPILLDCVEAKDMCIKYYTTAPNRNNTMEFLLFNPDFPRSVSSCLNKALTYLKEIEPQKGKREHRLEFKIAKFIIPFEYMEVKELDNNLPEFLEQLLSKIYKISDMIVEEYFN